MMRLVVYALDQLENLMERHFVPTVLGLFFGLSALAMYVDGAAPYLIGPAWICGGISGQVAQRSRQRERRQRERKPETRFQRTARSLRAN